MRMLRGIPGTRNTDSAECQRQVKLWTHTQTHTHTQLHRVVVVVVDKEIHLKTVVKNILAIVTACCCLWVLRGEGKIGRTPLR